MSRNAWVRGGKPRSGPIVEARNRTAGTNTSGKLKTIKRQKSCIFLEHFRISCIIKIKLSFGKLETQNSKRKMPLITNH